MSNALENSYAQHLLSGKALPINYNTYISQSQITTDMNFTVNVSRALTRLKSVFLCMTGQGHADNTALLKEFNQLWHPMNSGSGTGNAGIYDSTKEIECQVQIGSKLYPE